MLDDCLTALRELLMSPNHIVSYRLGQSSGQPTITSTVSVGTGEDSKLVYYLAITLNDIVQYLFKYVICIHLHQYNF